MKHNTNNSQKEVELLKQRIRELEKAESNWEKNKKALIESEQNYKDLVEKAGICILVDDKDGNLFFFNEKLAELLGYTSDELKKQSIRSIIHQEDVERVMEIHQLRMSGKKVPSRYEFRGQRKDGSTIYLEVDASILKKKGEIIGSRSYVWDITERKKSEKIAAVFYEISKAINETSNIDMLYPQIHKILWKVIDATNFYIALYDSQQDTIRFTYFTDEYDEEPEIKNASKSGSLSAEVIKKGKTLLLTHKQLAKKYQTPKEEWGTQPMVWLGVPLKIKNEVVGIIAAQSYTNPRLFSQHEVEVLESVSETIALAIQRKKNEDEKMKLSNILRQAQKMEAIGTLAGGIAHDFNNILGVLMGYTELLLRETNDQTQTNDRLKKIMKAALRAKDLVTQILTFSRKSDTDQRPLLIGKVIKEVVSFLKHTLPATISINYAIPKKEELILANSTEIYQVIINICTNSAQAIGDGQGKIFIQLEKIPTTIEEKAILQSTKNQYMVITVSDSGKGISPEIINRIFEPYFTTKKSSKGTGMGLAVVHGIVKSYGGEVKVKSTPGKGTTFKIYLPIFRIDKITSEALKYQEEIEGGHEKILFVDDESDIANLGEMLLGKLGYDVISKTSSLKALEIFKKDPVQFDLIITDMTMPQMTGLELAREIRQITANPPIIICTGYNEQLEYSDSEAEGIAAIVKKPFRLKEMSEIIRQVLKQSKLP